MKTVAQTVIEADHFYTIAAHTGNVIQAVEGTKEAGTVRLGKYEHKPEQEWSFIRVGDGVYRIRNRASGKLLDLTMTGTANGTWLHLWEDVGGTSQMWTVQPTPEGTVRLRSSWAGGKCVDTVGMGAAVGTVRVHAVGFQWFVSVVSDGADDQLWTIAEVKERAKRAAKKAEEPAVEAAAEAAPAAEKAPAKKTAARKPRTTKKAAAAKAEAAEEGKAETAAPAEKPAKLARKTAAKKTAAKAAEKAEPAKAEVPTEEKPAAEKPKRKCAPRKKKETV